jgi:hypothetical protein
MRDDIGMLCSTHDRRNTHRLMAGKAEKKKALGRFVCRWNNDIETYIN